MTQEQLLDEIFTLINCNECDRAKIRCERLLKNINQASEEGKETILMHVAKNLFYDNQIDFMKWLLAKGADLTLKDKWGRSALCICVQSNFLEGIEVLLNAGANINETDGITRRNLLTASPFQGRDNLDAMAYLIKKGIDINHQDYYGETALMYNIHYGKSDKVKLFVDAGIDLNVADKREGRTALMFLLNNYALYQKDKEAFKELVTYLLEHGADTEIKDIAGWSIFEYADLRKNREIELFLLQECERIKGKALAHEKEEKELENSYLSERYETAVLKEEKEKIVELFVRGYDINLLNKEGKTLLEVAYQAKNHLVLETVLTLANPDLSNQNNETLLHQAVQNNDIKTVQLLIKKGADLLKKNAFNEDAYQLAMKQGLTEIALFIENALKEKRKQILNGVALDQKIASHPGVGAIDLKNIRQKQ